jgi:hypothetical protein
MYVCMYVCMYCHVYECDYRQGMDWWINLLTTYTHDSELQAITAPLLISTIHKSLHAKSSPAFCVFTSRCLVTASNNGDSSVSVLTSLLSGEYPTAELSTIAPSLLSLPCKTQLSTDWIRVRVTLRLEVYCQSVRIGNKPLETHDQ